MKRFAFLSLLTLGCWPYLWGIDHQSISDSLKKPIEEIKKVTQPVKDAVTKTSQTAVKEAKNVALEAHTAGGKFLQGIINVMIAASPGKTRVYLPAPSSDPNSGITVGMLPVFLWVDKKERVEHIFAPSITHNEIFGVTSTLRHYWYPAKGGSLFLFGSYSMETNLRGTVRYENANFLKDWFYFKMDATISHDGSNRFFGLGPNSRFTRQANYNLRDDHYQIFTGLNLSKRYRITLANRFRNASVVDGPIDSLPQISKFLPRPAGVEQRAQTLAHKVLVSYDSRDLPMAPVQGHAVELYFENAGLLGGEVRYERLGASIKGFYPFRKARYVTAWRFGFDGENSDDAPLYEQALLGGKDSLRGFGDARFIDRNKVSYAIEERMKIYTLEAFNVSVDFEVAPFYEAGTVFNRAAKLRVDELHHVGGVGLRSVVRPNVVGAIEVGFSQEGTALFVGIDYPF